MVVVRNASRGDIEDIVEADQGVHIAIGRPDRGRQPARHVLAVAHGITAAVNGGGLAAEPVAVVVQPYGSLFVVPADSPGGAIGGGAVAGGITAAPAGVDLREIAARQREHLADVEGAENADGVGRGFGQPVQIGSRHQDGHVGGMVVRAAGGYGERPRNVHVLRDKPIVGGGHKAGRPRRGADYSVAGDSESDVGDARFVQGVPGYGKGGTVRCHRVLGARYQIGENNGGGRVGNDIERDGVGRRYRIAAVARHEAEAMEGGAIGREQRGRHIPQAREADYTAFGIGDGRQINAGFDGVEVALSHLEQQFDRFDGVTPRDIRYGRQGQRIKEERRRRHEGDGGASEHGSVDVHRGRLVVFDVEIE